jgi:hypothetical protein
MCDFFTRSSGLLVAAAPRSPEGLRDYDDAPLQIHQVGLRRLTGSACRPSCRLEVTMNAIRVVGAAALAAATVVAIHASGPVAVYARVDKVVIEPSPDAAHATIQIWGVFSTANPKRPNDFSAASCGYLYYSVPARTDYRQVALQEWNDLQAVAGTNQIVAFGSQFVGAPTVRKPDERLQSPDEYSLNFGIRKISGQTSFAPVRAILDFKP